MAATVGFMQRTSRDVSCGRTKSSYGGPAERSHGNTSGITSSACMTNRGLPPSGALSSSGRSTTIHTGLPLAI